MSVVVVTVIVLFWLQFTHVSLVTSRGGLLFVHFHTDCQQNYFCKWYSSNWFTGCMDRNSGASSKRKAELGGVWGLIPSSDNNKEVFIGEKQLQFSLRTLLLSSFGLLVGCVVAFYIASKFIQINASVDTHVALLAFCCGHQQSNWGWLEDLVGEGKSLLTLCCQPGPYTETLRHLWTFSEGTGSWTPTSGKAPWSDVC